MQHNNQELLPEIAENAVAVQSYSNAQQHLERAQTYVIDCPELAECATEDLKEIKAYQKELEAVRKAIKGPLQEKVKLIDNYFRAPAEYLDGAEAELKRRIGEFFELERKKREEEEIARRAAQEAEAARRAKAEVEARQRQSQHIPDAEQAEDADYEEVPAADSEPAAPMVAGYGTASTPDTKLSGISERVTWKAEVTDMKAFLAYIIETGDFLDSVTIPKGKLNKIAGLFKDTKEIPGLKISADRSIAVKAS